MTKLARVVQKIFGVNSGAKGTVAFGTAQNIIEGITPTYTKDIALIQNANFETGWKSAVPDNYAPFREDKTSVEMVLSRQLAYLYETGLAEYDATTNYCIGAECCVIDNLGNKSVYKSVIADNLGNAVSNTAYWTKLFEINASGVITYINNIFAPTPASGTNNTQVATTAFVNTALLGIMPTGVILPYGGDTAPTGYLLCNGGAISRTTYSALFSVIGTAYGAGDGNTTFNIPNGSEKYLGGNNRGYATECLPNIAGQFSPEIRTGSPAGTYHTVATANPPTVNSNAQGCFKIWDGTQYIHRNGGKSLGVGFEFNASFSSSTYQDGAKVKPDTLYSNMIIKY